MTKKPPSQTPSTSTSSENCERIVNAFPDLLVMINRQGNITELRYGSYDPSDLPFWDKLSIGKTLDAAAFPRDVHAMIKFHIDQVLQTGILQEHECELTAQNLTTYYEIRFLFLPPDEVMLLVRDISFMKTVNQQLSDSLAEITTLRAIENEITDTLNLNYALSVSLDAAMRLSNAQAGWIATWHEGSFYLAQTIGPYPSSVVEAHLNNIYSIWWRVAQTQQAEYIQTLSERPDVPPLLAKSTSAMIIPMISQDRLQGLIHLESNDVNRFNYSRFETITLMGRRIATTLENANLYRQELERVEELQRVYAALTKLEQLKTDMIRIASHDLRGPLAAVMGYTEMLRWGGDEKFDKATRGYLQQIEQSARQMQRIISGILSLERIDELSRNRLTETLDLALLAQRVYEELRPSLQAKHQDGVIDVRHAPIIILGDVAQMHEAISNLLSNAIKYTPDEGHISLTLEVVTNKAILKIEDTGYGIPEAQQARLFQPFFRAKTQETAGIEGTGLGLHLVKNIVERHGGQMIFQSTRGKGSTFGFEVDVVRTPDAAKKL
jgi:signal transduction histidine kinase